MSLTGNFDRLNKKKNGQKDDTQNPSDDQDIERYSTPAQVRNLCFVQADGKKLFLNYAYLTSGEYLPEDNTIKLIYTTHEITLKGRNLEGLFESLMANVPRQIMTVDKRYEIINSNTKPCITEMMIVRKND